MTLRLPLEPAAAEERPYTIREVVESARRLLDECFPTVWVEGEVSNFRSYDSGHWYFTLKDPEAQLNCTMWRTDAQRLAAPPAEGLKVFAKGALTVGPKRGDLRFVVRQLLPTGEGGWHAIALARARAALQRDGLLDPSRRRPLPRFPRRIGVVTSAEGAVWHDITAVVARRWPLVELILVGARVQGEDAPRDLVRALGVAGRVPGLDLLIVGRGGGSQEDLRAFNDEKVARAVAASPVPTISAVGHELDVTLTDLVADERAPTPSAAAEKAVPDRAEVLRHLGVVERHLARAAAGRVQAAALRLRGAAGRMAGAAERRVGAVRHRLTASRLRMDAAVERRAVASRARADRLAAALDALSPLRVLERGYAVARDAGGRVLRCAADFAPGSPFRLRVADGEVRARTEERP